MDWNSLIFGNYQKIKIQEAVNDARWQCVRNSMLGTTLEQKYSMLIDYLVEQEHSRPAQIRVTNYVNALKRGGLIK